MLRAALALGLLSRTRPRGPGLRWLWGRGAGPGAAGRRRAGVWGWRRLSSAPGPGSAHYQLVYTCKEYRRNPGGQRGEGVPSGWRWGPGAGFRGCRELQIHLCSRSE
uniref:DNL-type zinc finger n=1 Tax=Panthera leo TaxID=9689 RepID=A0A8C8XWA9_PANLE